MHSGEKMCLTVFLSIDMCNTERVVIHQNPFVKPHSSSTMKCSIEPHYPAAVHTNTNQQYMIHARHVPCAALLMSVIEFQSSVI